MAVINQHPIQQRRLAYIKAAAMDPPKYRCFDITSRRCFTLDSLSQIFLEFQTIPSHDFYMRGDSKRGSRFIGQYLRKRGIRRTTLVILILMYRLQLSLSTLVFICASDLKQRCISKTIRITPLAKVAQKRRSSYEVTIDKGVG